MLHSAVIREAPPCLYVSSSVRVHACDIAGLEDSQTIRLPCPIGRSSTGLAPAAPAGESDTPAVGTRPGVSLVASDALRITGVVRSRAVNRTSDLQLVGLLGRVLAVPTIGHDLRVLDLVLGRRVVLRSHPGIVRSLYASHELTHHADTSD